MSLATSIARVTEYYKRHGFAGTVRRAGQAAYRSLVANRFVVFYCDLTKLPADPAGLPATLRIERLRSERDLSARDLEAVTSFWNPELAQRSIHERFEKGASLWVIRSGEDLAGFGWTLRGSTMEPYFFPLRPDDMHFFDFHVLEEYRGRGLNPLLVSGMLRRLADEGMSRAFIEAAEWNRAQLSSLRKTPFLRLGLARLRTVFGHTFIHWSDKVAVEKVCDAGGVAGKSPAMARPDGR